MLGKRKKGVLPFAPPIDRWTDDHYSLYGLVELALGNRKELSKEEVKEMDIARQAEELVDSGDPNWLSKIQELMEGEGFGDLNIKEDLFEEINEEQLLRGE